MKRSNPCSIGPDAVKEVAICTKKSAVPKGPPNGDICSIFTDCGAKKPDILWELRGLRPSDQTRPCDVGWADFYGPGRHLLCDGSVVSVFVNSLASAASTKARTAARQKEDEKLQADVNSAFPVAFRHRLVPCVVEEGGRLGGH